MSDSVQPLEVDDLERLAVACYLTGDVDGAIAAWTRVHQMSTAADACRAVRAGFWIAFAALNGGDIALASGWVERSQRLLDDASIDCVEHGYLLYPRALRSVFEGDAAAGHAGFVQVAKEASRFGDLGLTALARIGEGRCLIFLGEVREGLSRLDEAIVAIGAGDVPAIAVGDSYCAAIEASQEVFDIRRAQQWTSALSHWCESQPELVMFRGQCLVHRAEIMLLHGDWDDAVEEAARACDRVVAGASPMVGRALYLRGELARLRGNHAEAESVYRDANDAGYDPQPGIALLRLAQARPEDAAASIARALAEAGDPPTRARLLPAAVEILLATDDTDAARDAADELATLAEGLEAPWLHASAMAARGALALSAGDAGDALASLRDAWRMWRDLDAPYESARARVRIAAARAAVGDSDGAEMELDAARSAFVALGASPDVAMVEKQLGPRRRPVTPPASGGITAREIEVIALVAQGKTNRAIADDLIVSEKTVASHLSHIFTKLGISSRAALTAYAYEHDLV